MDRLSRAETQQRTRARVLSAARDEFTVRNICPAVASGASFCVAPANTGRVGVAKLARLSTLNTSSLNCSLVSPFND